MLISRLALVLVLSTSTLTFAQQPQTPPKPAPTAMDHSQMNRRGAEVMGFDQEQTAHHFYLYADGGAIEVSVKNTADLKNRDAIRAHLPHIAMMFGSGDFSAPMMVHATDVPGTKVLAANKDKIAFTYVETPTGGAVNIVTSDAGTLAALHEFLRFQIADHKTGDALSVGPRKR
jgi:hypothetical protein